MTDSVVGGMPTKHKLNRNGDNLEPCGTTVCTILAFGLMHLQLETACLPLVQFDSHQRVAAGIVNIAIFNSSTLWLAV